MKIEEIIDKLKFSLENTAAEDKLLDTITVLQQELLEELTAISNGLRSFIALKEELSDVTSLQEYESLKERLVEIKRSLNHLPVCQRVSKEIRELEEKMPSIREFDRTNRRPKKDPIMELVSRYKRNMNRLK